MHAWLVDVAAIVDSRVGCYAWLVDVPAVAESCGVLCTVSLCPGSI